MPIKVGFTEADLTAIDKRLEGLSKFAAMEVLEDPLLESAQPAVDKWRQLAPQPGRARYTGPGRGRKAGKGGLADVIQSKVVRGKDTHVITLIVGADYEVAPHEHLVERGHDIVIGRQGQQTRTTTGRYTGRKTATPRGKAARRGGKVSGGFYGRKAMRQTATQRMAILLEHIGRVLDRQLKA
jgi:hypothetical protein